MGRVVVVAAILCLAACSRTHTDSQAARVDALFEKWNRTDAPGCAVGVSRNGSVLYEHGYGMANLEWGIPITPQTVFPIASISKSFTAMSVLLAADRGQLSLDDEVQKYIPEWQDRHDHITIRHLLTHTSGVRDVFTMYGWGAHGESADPNESITEILARQHGLNFVPGSEYQYNNSGYALLAAILKRATGQSLREYADANIFKPLAMSHSLFQGESAMLISNRASGYTPDANGWRAARTYTGNAGQAVVGNSGMYSTVGDLLRWEQNFDEARVGTPASISKSLAAMRQPIEIAGVRAATHGLGLGNAEYRGVTTVSSSGGDFGIASEVARFPMQRFAVAVLCNEDNVVTGGMARVNPDVFINGIADIYLADVLKPAAAAKAAPAPTPVKLSEKDLSAVTGLYRGVVPDRPLLFTINRGALNVRSHYGEGFDFELTPIGPNHFVFPGGSSFDFVPAAGGRPNEWHVGAANDRNVFQPVTFAPSAAELRAYAGGYRSDELDVTFTLEPRDSALVVKNVGFLETIVPFENDQFVGDVVGIVKFSRDARGTVTGFTLNRLVARGVRFERIQKAGRAG
jgi:CubicO group peptidase (beta-lactamase class C family)